MKPTRRQIRMTFVNSGESVVAEMLDDESPGVCEHVWKILPVETKVILGMYSGFEVFAMLKNPRPLPEENRVQLPLPGDRARPGGSAHGSSGYVQRAPTG